MSHNFTPEEIDKLESETRARIDGLLEENAGNSKRVLAFNAAKATQLPVLRMIYEELSAGTEARDLCMAITASFGASITQLASFFDPDNGDRQRSINAMLKNIEKAIEVSGVDLVQIESAIESGDVNGAPGSIHINVSTSKIVN